MKEEEEKKNPFNATFVHFTAQGNGRVHDTVFCSGIGNAPAGQLLVHGSSCTCVCPNGGQLNSNAQCDGGLTVQECRGGTGNVRSTYPSAKGEGNVLF